MNTKNKKNYSYFIFSVLLLHSSRYDTPTVIKKRTHYFYYSGRNQNFAFLVNYLTYQNFVTTVILHLESC